MTKRAQTREGTIAEREELLLRIKKAVRSFHGPNDAASAIGLRRSTLQALADHTSAAALTKSLLVARLFVAAAERDAMRANVTALEGLLVARIVEGIEAIAHQLDRSLKDVRDEKARARGLEKTVDDAIDSLLGIAVRNKPR